MASQETKAWAEAESRLAGVLSQEGTVVMPTAKPRAADVALVAELRLFNHHKAAARLAELTGQEVVRG